METQVKDNTAATQLQELFKKFPELNAAAIGRRLGMSQSMFAQYICGNRRPSPERMAAIMATVAEFSRELSDYLATLAPRGE